MIYVKAEIMGEPDVPPFIVVFEYNDKSDEKVFYNSVKMIKQKLVKNLKINVNESLVVYCAYIVGQIRASKSVNSIEKNATKVLSSNNVMIGVPESLRKISFEASVDTFNKKHITLYKPIPTSRYLLATNY